MHHTQSSEKSWTDFLTDTSTNVNNSERVVSAVAGGAMVAYGLKQGGMLGTVLTVLGGGMLLRGTTGHSYVYDTVGINTNDNSTNVKSPYKKGLFSGKVHVTKALTINKSEAELYAFWRNFENLPIFMRHLESVTISGDGRSHWKAKAPLGYSVEWDAEVTSDVPNEKIGWKSLEGSDIPNSGTVEFLPTTNRGTEVKVTLTYEAPGGKLGEWAAWLFGEEPSVQISEDLRRFKSLMETGLIMNTEGQSSGRAEEARPLARAARA